MSTDNIAQYSLAAGEPLTASASTASIWLLLEYNGTWGAKALEESTLPERVKNLLITQANTFPNSRVQFIKQNHPHRSIHFYVAHAHPVHPMLFRFRLGSYDDLLDMDIPALASAQSEQTLSEDRLFLVCTNGKRDACCAKNGLPLYNALSAIDEHNVWQTTHIGGHRFAATMVCLPHGICYGRVPSSDAASVIQAYHKNRLLPEYYRGCAAYTAPVQAAEAFLHQQTGDNALDAFRLKTVEMERENDWTVAFNSANGTEYTVRVRGEQSTFSVYSSTNDAEPKPVMQYRVEESA